ncbi:MAG: hypothetical protein LDL13_05545 [Calditerrivibrio sp.]|nr:hypothetical protein [Calditerrivibrio sp.]MCA1933022.1 hypothetical protein [Calditerrivibrio sp.]
MLLLSKDIDEVKRIYNLCKEKYIFYFFDSEVKCRDFLINEKVDVAIINQHLVEEPLKLMDDLRDEEVYTSFIFIGDDNSHRIRELLKSGYYDYLFNDYSDEDLLTSIEKAIENKDTYEKIRSISFELEQSNNKLLEKARELENDKIQLNNIINKFRLIESFIKDVNFLNSVETISNKVVEYISKEFNENKIIFTSIDNYIEKVLITAGKGVDILKGMQWDLKDIKSAPWAESIIKAKVKVDVQNPIDDVWYSKTDLASLMPGGFLKCPIHYGNITFGTVVISYEDGKPYFTEEQIFYLNQIIEHTAIQIYNKKLNEKLTKTIEQLKDYQQQLIEKEKLSTLAKVAVSVNHEINNPLCAISLNTELIKRRYKDDENLQKITDGILNNVSIINKITNKFANLRKVEFKEYLPGIEMLDLGDD